MYTGLPIESDPVVHKHKASGTKGLMINIGGVSKLLILILAVVC
jgi:hypothetical protein